MEDLIAENNYYAGSEGEDDGGESGRRSLAYLDRTSYRTREDAPRPRPALSSRYNRARAN